MRARFVGYPGRGHSQREDFSICCSRDGRRGVEALVDLVEWAAHDNDRRASAPFDTGAIGEDLEGGGRASPHGAFNRFVADFRRNGTNWKIKVQSVVGKGQGVLPRALLSLLPLPSYFGRALAPK